ncbi:PH domain-containing protein [Lacticaseibacillus jixianensis]|uniref:PH domain-containing protein n=1 Tax=Lacticaseibacillus jixianensis TaxID=2486012 RepID=A0ABW4B937_9LACO|nr:PH domain-containing protein [Lacticaseibacillus jixianensis]
MDEMKGEQLPAQIKTVWRTKALIDGVIWLVITIFLVSAWRLWGWPWWLAAVAGAATILHPGIHLVLIPYRYRFWRYLITPTAVYSRSGYIFRSEKAVPISRIQNVTLESGPLMQWQGLQEVQVQTASTTDTIAGVTKEVAAQLRDRIMQLAQEARDEG